MTYYIQYEPDYLRVLPAILIDCRAQIPAIKNQVGSVIKSYTDSQLALITQNSLFYKIETDKGVIANVFSLDVNTSNKTVTLVINKIRPAFLQFSTEINEIINNFITSKGWFNDYLFD